MRAERLEAIDALRGIAALAVVLYHFTGFMTLLHIPTGTMGSMFVSVIKFGYLGVPVFFTLSGFVIAMTAARYEFNVLTAGRFVLRRMVRLVPPYWTMIALITFTFLVGQAIGLYANTRITTPQVAASVVYLQEILAFPALDVAYWTLCLEVQFYLVFAGIAVVCKRGRLVAVIGLLTLASLAADVWDLVPQAWWPRLWYQFGIGVLTWLAGTQPYAKAMLWIVLLSVLASGLCRGHAPDVVVVITSLVLIARNSTRVAMIARQRPLLWLGSISYSLYLVHGLIRQGLGQVFRRVALTEPQAWAVIVVATLLAIAFATAFYFVIERRAVRWSRAVRIDDRANPLSSCTPLR